MNIVNDHHLINFASDKSVWLIDVAQRGME